MCHETRASRRGDYVSISTAAYVRCDYFFREARPASFRFWAVGASAFDNPPPGNPRRPIPKLRLIILHLGTRDLGPSPPTRQSLIIIKIALSLLHYGSPNPRF